ncbi:hypothetical protein [Terriglobus albidus]|uniref:hypothetical protein n=1 Tax=Terriglobus albidus TaxID=1592106 RepID=UPI0021E06CFC|nr:hypothetical protein [Terriglobus albidus]
MAIQKTPHTQPQQNVDVAQSELAEDQAIEDLGLSAEEERRYVTREAGQMGGDRAPLHTDQRQIERHSVQSSQAPVGKLNTRTPEGKNQGITSHSASEESARQHKVTDKREDAQAGVNRFRKSA